MYWLLLTGISASTDTDIQENILWMSNRFAPSYGFVDRFEMALSGDRNANEFSYDNDVGFYCRSYMYISSLHALSWSSESHNPFYTSAEILHIN